MSAKVGARLCAAVLLSLCALAAPRATAQTAPSAATAQTTPSASGANHLQAPRQRSTRYSAYALPSGVWSIAAGFMGVDPDELYGRLGVARGFNHGVQLELNVLHWGAGLLNTNVRWNFYDTRHLSLSTQVGFLYAHGNWLWILSDFAQEVVKTSDLVAVPINLTASSVINRWLELDLVAAYRYSEIFGDIDPGKLIYADTQIGLRQLAFRPGARVFLSDATALELNANLPAYTRVPIAADGTVTIGSSATSGSHEWSKKAPFSKLWAFEAGVRSRLRPWLFATLRIQYGQVAKQIYGAPLFPSFDLEFRL